MSQFKSKEEIIKMYNNSPKFNTSSGGKKDNVYLAIGNKKFPKSDKGLSGVFYRDNKLNTPWFTSVDGVSYNLNTYVPFDQYGEPVVF